MGLASGFDAPIVGFCPAIVRDGEALAYQALAQVLAICHDTGINSEIFIPAGFAQVNRLRVAESGTHKISRLPSELFLAFALSLHFWGVDAREPDRNMVAKQGMNARQAHHARIPVITGVIHGLLEIERDLTVARSRPQHGDCEEREEGAVRHGAADSIRKPSTPYESEYWATKKILQGDACKTYEKDDRGEREQLNRWL